MMEHLSAFKSLLLRFACLQMVVPFSPLWSHFLLLFTVVHILYNVSTVIRVCEESVNYISVDVVYIKFIMHNPQVLAH